MEQTQRQVEPHQRYAVSRTINQKHIDILLGTDYPQFHTSINEAKGKNQDPVAILTPLGWTCVGQPVTPTTQLINLSKKFM